MPKFTALSEAEVDQYRLQAAKQRLAQLEIEAIQVGEALEQLLMGDPTEEHTATQLATMQKSKEMVDSVHKKYAARVQELTEKAELSKAAAKEAEEKAKVAASPVDGAGQDVNAQKDASPVQAAGS